MKYKRNVIEGAVRRVSEAPEYGEKIGNIGLKNNIRDREMFETLNKIIEGKKNLMQYRGNPSQLLAAKVRQISGAQIFFTARKLKTCLPSLKTSFIRELRSKVLYKLACSGCNSTYVGQTVRNLGTRVDEHRKEDSSYGQHLLECNKEVGGTVELKSEIKKQTANTQKQLTLEALRIWRESPRINTRDEFRSRELTLKL